MSESSFSHIAAPSSSEHYFIYVTRTGSSKALSKLIRVGRGVVSRELYERGAPKEKHPPTVPSVSPISHGSESPNPVENSPQRTKLDWCPNIFRPRSLSLSSKDRQKVVVVVSPTNDNEPPMVSLAEGEELELGQPGPGPSTLANQQANTLEIYSFRPEGTSPRLSDTYLGVHSLSAVSSPLHLPNLASQSPCISVVSVVMEYQHDRCPEEEDESARALLEALGIGSAPERDSQAVQEPFEDLTPEPETPQSVPNTRPTIRRLPSIPRSHLAQALPSDSPLVHTPDSHDTFADAGPRQSGVPPPPYVPPQSAEYNRPQMVHEDAPSAIRRKIEEQAVQCQCVVEH